MAIPVLVVLAVLWAAFFLWPLLQGRSSGRRADSVGDFSYRLGVIGKTGGHLHLHRRRPTPSPIPLGVEPARALAAASAPSIRSGSTSRAQRRRRDVLLVLGCAVLSTLLLALLAGSPLFWMVQLLADALLGAYVVLLVRMKRATVERRVKVHYLPPVRSAPAMALRRTASS